MARTLARTANRMNNLTEYHRTLRRRRLWAFFIISAAIAFVAGFIAAIIL